MKSAFVRDQAPDDEMCLVLGGLFTGPARNWYRQLSRTTRVRLEGAPARVPSAVLWTRSLGRETILPCEAAREERPIRRSPRARGTLDDHDLAAQLALLGISDADALEEILRARQRAKNRQRRAHISTAK
ncbi:hypothetical protein PPTG_05867 [Phytophthora nicotianae INRA-310]|uniref:Uncharacterized protein n=1 Tax=Phytophthora nicotianae (strain INRA-310) TaxID=761204 RepID=W2QWR9_PHYN3|nr:hypothetical protein PPTG_05867 [Phytophthora nicotianae INRA-310]ETN16720.1 hypothetical protein PPTG_05867 [Phytophthora nicotianae INRA-310]